MSRILTDWDDLPDWEWENDAELEQELREVATPGRIGDPEDEFEDEPLRSEWWR